MIKQLFIILCGFFYVSSVGWAASPVANIKITGNIKPPTCIVNGGNNELLYALGNYSPGLIPATVIYPLPSLSNLLVVSCDAETYLTFRAIDAHADVETIIPDTESILIRIATFNLVNAENTAQQIGGISFLWSNVTVDSNPAYISRANDNDEHSDWNVPNTLTKNITNGWTSITQKDVPLDELALLPGKTFSATFYNRSDNNRSYLLPRDTLNKNNVDLSDHIDFIGQAILTFNFGI